MNCKWYNVCPLRRFERLGLINDEWRRRYCEGDYTNCERYKEEKTGVPHSDELLPDGTFLSR